MKSEDLMIGDWVRIIDDDTDAFFDAMVEGIDSLANIYATMPCDETAYPYSADCAKPIPLTTEILENSGWKHDPPVQRAMINTNFQRNNYLAMSWDSKSHILNISARRDCDINISCEYVHELQHALRLCGIDKTIKL